MNKVLTTFIDRLADRLTVLVSRFISSRIEGLQAEIQAEQQSQLEDLARRYEAEGKLQIAATLRERLAKLVSTDAAAEAVESIRLIAEPGLPSGEFSTPAAELHSLPNFGATPTATSKSRRKVTPRIPTQDSEMTP